MIGIDGYEFIDGGICAASGFVANGVHCGLRKNVEKPDLALVYSKNMCTAAAVYTQNKVKGAPLKVTKDNISDGKAQAIIVNSGNANTCNIDGEEKAMMMCEIAAKGLNINAKDVIVASTGIIGEKLPINLIENAANELIKGLSVNGSDSAAKAILTTDLVKKEVAVKFTLGGKECKLGGMAKGSGMIHPNMATMLCFMTTDVAIDALVLKKVLLDVTNDTFNMISVDGDTSTNDMALVMASGSAKNALIDDENSNDCKIFKKALYCVMMNLSRMMAKDGEGASKLLECRVNGALDTKNAKIIAKSVITSSLFKSAMFGQDPNWGRILCAVGYADAEVDIDKVEVLIEANGKSVCVCQNGRGVDFSAQDAKDILSNDEVTIVINLGDGDGKAVAWGCDLTYDYVKINAAYHT